MFPRIIKHRVNSISELKALPKDFGCEIDLRFNPEANNIYLNHDPENGGDNFEEWLNHFDHSTLIINVKELGLEKDIFDYLKKYKINDFFLLDQPTPYLINSHKFHKGKAALRISEFEPIEALEKVNKFIDWIWLDCFEGFPISSDEVKILNKQEKKVCIVSPELQGRSNKKEILNYKNKVENLELQYEAVCTKYPELWKL